MFNVISHNGTVTIRNKQTGAHRTVRIRTQPKDAKFAPGERVVELLDGSDNEHSYRGFGFVKPSGVVLWSKNRTPFFVWMRDFLVSPESKTGVDVLFEGKCRVCNRKLTTPESIETGIGPVCARKD